MTGLLNELIARYGVVAMFVAVWVECMGIPVPAETALVVVAAYSAHHPSLNPLLVFGVAAAAAILGDNTGYGIGRFGGWPLVRRWGHRVRLDESRLKVARYVFATRGAPVVALGRFVALLRTTAAFLAGVNQMPWGRFLVFNALGGIAWAATWTVVGYHVGNTVTSSSGPLSWVLLGGVVVAAVVGFVLTRRHWSRLREQAEAAYPGPL